MNNKISDIKKKNNDKKLIIKTYKSFFEFRKKAREKRLEILGYDVKKLIHYEKEIIYNLKKQDDLLINICKCNAKSNAKILESIEKQSSDWRCGSTRLSDNSKYPPGTPDLVDPFDPLGRKTRDSGSIVEWDYLKTLDNCKNSRVLVDVYPPDDKNESYGSYISGQPCKSKGRAEITGSGEDNIAHECSIKMMHDFEFIAMNDDYYRFTPEFFINAIVSLSSFSTEFYNLACIDIKIGFGDEIKSERNVFAKGDTDLFAGNVTIDSISTGSPRVIKHLEEQDKFVITVICELFVKAKNLANAVLDLASSEYLYFWAPRLRVEYEKRTLKIHEKPRRGEIITVPRWIEDIGLPRDPLNGFSIGR